MSVVVGSAAQPLVVDSVADDEMRRYLVALFSDLPEGQYIAIASSALRMASYAEPDIDSAEKRVHALRIHQGVASNIYIGVNPTSVVEERVSKSGRKRLAPIRKAENVKFARSFWADIDFGKPDQTTSMADPAELASVMGEAIKRGDMLAPSMVVASGVGLHLYWLLDQWITASEWYPLAVAMQNRLRNIGVRMDPITADAARILRPPGTWHNKGEDNSQAKLVRLKYLSNSRYTVQEMRKLLTSGAALQVIPGGAGKAASSASSDLGVITPPARPAPLEVVWEHCATLRGVREREGAGDTEPLWQMVLFALAFYGEEARAEAHKMSRGHAEYEPSETDAKFDAKLAAVASGSVGWPTCDSFSTLSQACNSCPFRYRVKSPLGLDRISHSDLPPGYVRRKDPTGRWSYIWRIIHSAHGSDDDDAVLLLPCDIRDARLEMSEEGPVFSADIIRPHSSADRLRIPLTAINTWRDKAQSVLGSAGIVIDKSAQTHAQRFFVAFVTLLQQRMPIQQAVMPYGWAKDGFAINGILHTGGQRRNVAQAHPVLSTMLGEMGSMEAWQEAAHLVLGPPRPQIHAMVAASFAAPLVYWTGQTGLVVSAYGESGAQKSSAVKLAQAVWGHPQKAILTGASTANSVIHRVGLIRHLPIIWDEVRQQDIEGRFPEIIFQFSQGVEKSRLTSDIQVRQQGTWATTMLIASNFSVQSLVAEASQNHAAAANRILEFDVPPMPPEYAVSVAEADSKLAALLYNYGVVGRTYADFLARRGQIIKDDLTRAIKAIEAETGATPDERFWITCIACLLVGAAYAVKLNLAPFDVAAMREFLLDLIPRQRKVKIDLPLSPSDPQFLADVMFRFRQWCQANNKLLVTDVFHLLGRPGMENVEILMLDSMRNQLRAPIMHIAQHVGMVRILPAEFKQWCVTSNIDFSQVIKGLEALGMARVKKVWCAGTPWSSGQTRVWEINVKGTYIESAFYTPSSNKQDGG